MKKTNLIFLFFTIVSFATSAQNFELKVLGNKDEVRMYWQADFWPDSLLGVEIKRKQSGEQWTTFTGAMYPETKGANDLSTRVVNKKLRTELLKERTDLIAKGRLRAADETELREKLKGKGVKNMTAGFSRNFNMSIFCGFGAIDSGLEKGKVYEYGLFPVYTNSTSSKALDTYLFTGGGIPTFDKLEAKASYKVDQFGGIQIIWELQGRLNYKIINGFNVYKTVEGESKLKMNKYTIWASKGTNGNELVRVKDKVIKGKKVTYEMVALTSFNTEHGSYKYIFDSAILPPDELSLALQKPKIVNKEIVLDWTLPLDEENFVMSFQVKRRMGVGRWELLAENVPANLRTYIDNQGLQNKSSYFYKIVAIYKNDMGNFGSNDQDVYYKFTIPVIEDTSIKAKPVTIGDEHFIAVSWEKAVPNESVKGYRLRWDKDPNHVIEDNAAGILEGNSYQFQIYNSEACYYYVALDPIPVSGKTEASGNIMKVLAPSRILHPARLNNATYKENNLTVTWSHQWRDQLDLKGYIVYAGDKELARIDDRNAKDWTGPTDLEAGAYQISIVAYTESDLKSRNSNTLRVLVK